MERLERLERTDPRGERSAAVERLERLELWGGCAVRQHQNPSSPATCWLPKVDLRITPGERLPEILEIKILSNEPFAQQRYGQPIL